MRVVTPRRLNEFSRKHAMAKTPLLHWYEIVKQANWENLSDVSGTLEPWTTLEITGMSLI